MEERFKKQLMLHMSKLSKSNKGADALIEKLRKKVTYYDKYNPAALACADYFYVNKTDAEMNKCVEYLASVSEINLDSKEVKEGLKMDILRYMRVFQ